jgi:hypothetical protein
MMSAAELRAGMAHMTGTTTWTRYSPMFRQLLLTDGAKFLAEKAEAYWLMDAIGSHIFTNRKLSPQAEPIQFWAFKQDAGKRGHRLWVTDGGKDDNEPKVIAEQWIEYTDFPLDEIKFYAAWDGGLNAFVLMLPSEY